MMALRMVMDASEPQPPARLLRALIPLLNSDFIDMLGSLWRLGKQIITSKTHEGMYEVLDLDVRLELKDVKGKKATLYKRERVRFLQNNIIAYQDKAWGDGNIIASYKCTPGLPVDRCQDGYRHRILISLRDTKQANDIEEFRIERTIKNGFTQNEEYFQVDIDHTTHNLSFSIIFPRKRFPKQVTLVEKNTARSKSLGSECKITLPDGRQQITWGINTPKLFEGYILRWQW
jgi:hypothetical protein